MIYHSFENLCSPVCEKIKSQTKGTQHAHTYQLHTYAVGEVSPPEKGTPSTMNFNIADDDLS